MEAWRSKLVEDDEQVRALLAATHRIAVLGIKPESRRGRAAFYVPAYMRAAGYDVVPVPVYYPEVEEILGLPVYRSLVDVPGEVDMVNVFRRPDDIPPHLPDILEKRPASVWFQLGIRNDDAARVLAEAGIQVVQDRCLMADHQRLAP